MDYSIVNAANPADPSFWEHLIGDLPSSMMTTTVLFTFLVVIVTLLGFCSYGMAIGPLFRSSNKQQVEKMLASSDEALHWWEDLAPPFRQSDLDFSDPNADVVHFCFLVHGHRGFSRDLSYLQTRMRRSAAEEMRRRYGTSEPSTPASSATDSSSNPASSAASTTTATERQDIVVHAAVANERKTADGVKQGGERLVEEIVTVVRQEMWKRQMMAEEQEDKQNPYAGLRSPSQRRSSSASFVIDEEHMKDITISMLGNSLGGIYSRYAIAKLAERCKRDEARQCFILDGLYRIHFNVFCTTATPHLGVAGHTFLPIPRTAEIGVAHAMGDTGRDLFRLNDLMKEMATTKEFLEPLGCFNKRIAYANAYGTDFPVPAQTAAFLSDSSAYPHHFYENTNEDDRLVVDDNGFVIATLHTPARSQFGPPTADDDHCHVNQNDTDELQHMSSSLDALGWKKVFIDVRKEIPKIPIPQFRSKESSDTIDDTSKSASEDSNEAKSPTKRVPIHILKEKGVAPSHEVADAVRAPLFDEKFHWPMGHNMIVAFSRSRFSTYMNKAGRPFVDLLSSELVKDIFAWKRPKE